MLKLFSFLIFTFSFLQIIPCRADITTGLVGWWKLDEGSGSTTADSSGNGHTGTLQSSPTWISGKIGPYALSFVSASDQDVTMGNVLDMTTSSFSVSVWAKFTTQTAANNFPSFVSKTYDNAGRGYNFVVDTNAGGTSNDVFAHIADTTDLAVQSSETPTRLDDNNWHQYVMVVDRTAQFLYFYVDNTIIGSPVSTASLGSLSSTASLVFAARGAGGGGIGNWLDGSVDDVRIYNRILTASDVAELYATTNVVFHNVHLSNFHVNQ